MRRTLTRSIRLFCGMIGLMFVTERMGLASDYFLTIGGGYAPAGNQASLENNVLFFQRVLDEQKLDKTHNDVYFADGTSEGSDLQVMDPQSVPKANRLMAEFFGTQDSLGLSYRNHRVPNVRGSTRPDNIRNWFAEVGTTMASGDRLLLFVTAHGNKSADSEDPYNTTIATWNNSSIKMREFVDLLDGLPVGVKVVAIMVQCHSGGFAKLIYNGGDPDQGLSPQQRCAFFATVHDRPAAGCTPEVDESSYVEYSTYFWAALSGRSRTGDPIPLPDYNDDGVVSFDEAHAYTILTADTIDLPIKTSGEFLSQYSKFGDGDAKLLSNEEPYDVVLGLATTTQRVILEGLSEQLNLKGNDRLVDAWNALRDGRRRGRSRRRNQGPSSESLRRKIAGDLKRKWPPLANVANPVSVELMTSRSEEFIAAIENHRDYKRYRELADRPKPDPTKRNVKFDRFLRVADNVLLAENLRRLGDAERIAQYEALLAAESGSLVQ
ncbi:hypothetical protein [Stieleria mannarensis]|uniref:hypothetical protein n=1 Tax=Stieleria mannarensis TaxID=2755585 RepID=UPI003369C895